MPTDTETFARGAQQFAGAELELRGDGAWGWVLTGRSHRVGTLRWDSHTEARWEIASCEGRWDFEWHGRWPRRFFARDEAGAPVAWFEGRRIARGGAIVLAGGHAADLRRSVLRGRHWRLTDDEGLALATLTHGREDDAYAARLAVERHAAGHPTLTMVLLTACAVVRLDENYGSPVSNGIVPSLGGGA